jgi:hypothetical protein
MELTIAFVKLYKFEPVFKNLRLVLTLRIFLIINSSLVCLPWVLPRGAFDLVSVAPYFILCRVIGCPENIS